MLYRFSVLGVVMKAGKLKDRVVLQKMTEEKNDYGEQIKTWVNHSEFWAHVIPLSGKEALDHHAKLNVQGYKVRFRPRADISVADRLAWNGQVLEIETPPIDPYGRKDEYNITCKAIIDA